MANFLAAVGEAVPGIMALQHEMAVDKAMEQQATMRNYQIEEYKREQERLNKPHPVELLQTQLGDNPELMKHVMGIMESNNAISTVNGQKFFTQSGLNMAHEAIKNNVDMLSAVTNEHYQVTLSKEQAALTALTEAKSSGADQKQIEKLQHQYEIRQQARQQAQFSLPKVAEAMAKAQVSAQAQLSTAYQKEALKRKADQDFPTQGGKPSELEYSLRASRVGTPQEQPGDKEAKAALDYKTQTALKTTEARGKGFAEYRPVPVVDTKKNTAIDAMSQADVVEANRKESGRYKIITPSAFEHAMKQTALISDIRMNIQATRESVSGLKTDFNQEQRFKIFEAMRTNNPQTALSNLIGGEFGKNLTQDQQQYLVDVQALTENAMAMRAVLGAGQGSEDLRNAIKATIPSPTTFSKDYANKQLVKFDQILNRLESGVLKVKLRTDTGTPSGETKPAYAYIKRNPATGARVGYNPQTRKWEAINGQ